MRGARGNIGASIQPSVQVIASKVFPEKSWKTRAGTAQCGQAMMRSVSGIMVDERCPQQLSPGSTQFSNRKPAARLAGLLRFGYAFTRFSTGEDAQTGGCLRSKAESELRRSTAAKS
jgi:hypothetical protein